ncbi:purple acid phosphatase family protein [Cystobacter ferrugineus]|uniref:Metallophosphoesterase n=1 Tax=Cystobacter ferrugineus TaxID=83449 RepID=A0A1L9BB65_9BACT|nr:metallophosphoesterase family protein [Cystobacter ferrugineus]OJH39506.1 metallophosphoesterase [Cystobacter ferrugineus]
MHRLYSLALGAMTVAFTLTASGANAAKLTRDPYLQRVGPDTAMVAFRLDTACAATVRYGTHGSTDQTVTAPAQTRQAVVLDGLEPGTEYTYVVDACGSRTSPVTFSTAPVPGTRSVHFTTVGDFGSNNQDQRDVSRAMLGRKPQFFLALGDNAYEMGTEAEFQHNLFEPMAPLLAQVPFFAVPGNHEYETNQGQPYFDNLYLPTSQGGGEYYYSFDWGHVHFVAIDSNCAIGLSSADRCTFEAQKKWVEQDLAASTAPWKIAFFHHPPWSSGDHGSQLKMRREFAPLFEKYGVDLVLTGHDHNYERTHPMRGNEVAPSGATNPVYLVVGSGGAKLRELSIESKPSWSVLRNNSDHGYLDVRVEGGTLTAQMLTPSGKVMDSFTLTKDLPPEPAPPTQQPAPTPGTTPPAPAPSTPGQPPPLGGSTQSPPGGVPDLGDPDDPAETAPGCSATPVMTLLPAGMWVVASALRRRRR